MCSFKHLNFAKIKKIKKTDFDQHLECKAPKHCSKYTTILHNTAFNTPHHIITHPSTHAPPHAPTHARPSWPINQKPNPIPAEEYTLGLHDTAAELVNLPFYRTRVRSDLPGYLSDSEADGVSVINWYHRQFRDAAR